MASTHIAKTWIASLRADLAAQRLTVEEVVRRVSSSARRALVEESNGNITPELAEKFLWAAATTVAQILQHDAPGPIASA